MRRSKPYIDSNPDEPLDGGMSRHYDAVVWCLTHRKYCSPEFVRLFLGDLESGNGDCELMIFDLKNERTPLKPSDYWDRWLNLGDG